MRVMRVCTAISSRPSGAGASGYFLALFLLAAALTGAGVFRGHAQSPAQLSGSDGVAAQAKVAASAQAPVSAPVAVAARPAPQAVVNGAPADAKEQIAQLMQMATDLKAEVDKTNKDELSVTVVRKASAIEQLARKVKNAWPAKDR